MRWPLLVIGLALLTIVFNRLDSGGPMRTPEKQATSGPSSYAILARDPLTGRYGVAAASHAPLIGMNLEFLDRRAGGVVVLGGPYLEVNERVLTALRDELAPSRAIAVGLVGDSEREERQVLAISPSGVAVFSGKHLPKHVAHESGDFFVAAGHRLVATGVVKAMADAFIQLDGPLALRLLRSLEAGRDAGGEEGGAHSAALLVVGPGSHFATRDRLVDLRVDFVPGDAVTELAKLHASVDSVYGVVR